MTAWRLLGGLGFGAAFPNALALTSEWLPERWRSYAITTLSVGTPAGGSIAAALAPGLLGAFGWRGTFVAFGFSTLLLVLLIGGLLRDSPPFLASKGKLEAARRQASRVTVANVEFSSEPGERRGRDPAALVGVFHPMNQRLNWGVGIGFAASTLVAYSIISWGTTFLTSAHFALQEALQTSFAVGITSIIGAVAAGYLARRFGSKAVILSVSVILVVMTITLALLFEMIAGAPDAMLRVLIPALVAAVSGVVSVGIATIYVMMTLGYPQSCRSSGIGFGVLTGRVGAILASFGGGYLIDFGAGSLVPFFSAMLVGAVLVSAAALVVDRHVEPAR
jgi:AAHS family 4-hydroxybenzoate transporter-like MFS transporter